MRPVRRAGQSAMYRLPHNLLLLQVSIIFFLKQMRLNLFTLFSILITTSILQRPPKATLEEAQILLLRLQGDKRCTGVVLCIISYT